MPAGTFEDNARWLIGELDHARIAEAILVAHSYAGGMAITAAVAYPERVRGLVLVASIGPGCLDGWDRLLAAPIAGPMCDRRVVADPAARGHRAGRPRTASSAAHRPERIPQLGNVGKRAPRPRCGQLTVATLILADAADAADKMIPVATPPLSRPASRTRRSP
ncbi:MAG: hypothetical protein M3N95_09175 [Actinomycetota bacterium]|nr:hypothetical protein [Actinomycetota bacterium]